MKLTASIAAVVLTASAAFGDVATLTASKDNTLWNDLAGATSNGSGPVFVVGVAGGTSTAPVRRALLAFDVAASVPAGSTITAVQLVLVQTSGNPGPSTAELHRALGAWGEGASSTSSGSGAPAQAGDATCLHGFYASTFWTNPGGDFAATISASLAVGAVGTHTFPSTAQAVADVQSWLDGPATDFGWLIKFTNEVTASTADVFASSEAVAAANRPKLVVTFTPPAPSVYCTAKTNSQGCVPAIAFNGAPQVAAGGTFDISLSNAINQQNGLLFYGTSGASSAPFHGGTLCVNAPLVRLPLANAGGQASPTDCSGSHSVDFNARIASGADPLLVAGAQVWAQFWTRDPASTSTTNTSDALHFLIAQ